MQTVWPPTRDSIFGDTYGGVPNPMVPHRHPWPTRYHGPIYTVPGVAKPSYRMRPYARAPYMGTNGLGASPFDPLSGSRTLDAVGGAVIGYLVAPKPGDAPLWAIAGAFAGYAAGFMGMAGTLGVGIYVRKKR
jgi:hypothetical protein